MFFSKHKANPKSGLIDEFPPSQVNPLYKPKTLAEMRAEMVHTGINPAPSTLRKGVVACDGMDPMDAPPVPVTGDTFEHIRIAKNLKGTLESKESDLKEKVKTVKDKGKAPEPSPTPTPSE